MTQRTQTIHEGTPQELAAYLCQHPYRQFRLIELNEEEQASDQEPTGPMSDEKRKAAIATLDRWLAEGRAADEQTKQEAAREEEEIKHIINASRAEMGEEPLYP